MSDVFVLNGTTLDLFATDALPIRFRERFGQTSTLTIQRRGIQPPAEASDTWLGKSLTWTHNGTLYFSGTIRSRSPRRDPIAGWVIDYQAHGLLDKTYKFPLTDKTTGLDISPFNQSPEDLINFNAARAGRTVGQILTDVLTSNANANTLNSYGLGNYTGLPTTPALPASTVADLAALSIVPPRPCYVTGEKFGDAIEGFLQQWGPNIRHWIKPDGTIRFLDMRTFSTHTFTMGSDPIEPTELSRDVGDCFQRILVRGAPIAVMFLFKLSLGTLLEDFTWGAFGTNSAAKAAWSTNDFKGTSKAQSVGTSTCPSTTTVVVTSSVATETWPANYWDQTATGVKGIINLNASVVTGVTSNWTARIVANTALAAGGTSTLTIDAPLPVLTYNHYTISGNTAGASQVWRKYKIADSTLWPLVVAQSTYPQPFVNAGGGATVTSTPMGAVFWPQSGSSPPFNMFPLPFVYDGAGHVVFLAPTFTIAQNAAPADVWALLPVNTGPNRVASPVDVSGVPQFAGSSHTVEGLSDTLTVTMADWRDPGQVAQLQAYANDLLDSVKDGVTEGSVLYHGMYEPALTFGLALNIAGLKDDGTADTTGWESAALPIVEVELEFSQGPEDYITTMTVSNRRAHYTAEMFLRPERTGLGFLSGMQGDGFNVNAESGYLSLGRGISDVIGHDMAGQIGDEGMEGLINGVLGSSGSQTNLGSPDVGAGFGGGGDLNFDPTGGFGTDGLQGSNNLGGTGTNEGLMMKGGKPNMIRRETSDQSHDRTARQPAPQSYTREAAQADDSARRAQINQDQADRDPTPGVKGPEAGDDA